MARRSKTRPSLNQLWPDTRGLTKPMVGFTGGISRLLLEAASSSGLACILWTYVSQAPGDVVELFCASPLSIGGKIVEHRVTKAKPAAEARSPSWCITASDISRGNANITVPAHPSFTLGATVILHMEGGFNAPRGVAVTPDGEFAYVANAGNHTVSLVVL